MNSLIGKELEIYNFGQIGASTEYDDILINKDIHNYFNDLISKSTTSTSTSTLTLAQNNNIIKSNYNFEKFYFDYIEHNMIFIVVLIGIIIFLIIRYYVKDFDSFDLTNSNDNLNNDDVDSNNDNVDLNNDVNSNNVKKNKISNIKYQKNKFNKLAQIKKKQHYEKIKLINYKKKLDEEKKKILSIIDELSNINQYENSQSNSQFNSSYLDSNINSHYNIIDNQNQTNGLNFFNEHINNFEKSPHNLDDNSHYYDINKKFDDEINKINGLYVEPPFDYVQ